MEQKNKDFGIIDSCKAKAIITKWKSAEQYIYDLKTGGTVKNKITKLRKYDKKTQRKEYDEIKYQLPSTTAPNFKNNHCTNANYLGNTWMLLDVDNLTPEQIIQLKAKINKLPYVICCYLSCGGKGLRIIIKTSFMANDTVYKSVFAVVEKEINSYLGVKIDTACKDSRRLSFDSYDPECFYNPDAVEYIFDANVAEVEVVTAQQVVKKNNGCMDWNDTLTVDASEFKEPMSQDEKIKKYIDTIPGAVTGQNGSSVTFTVAMALIEGFKLSAAQAMSYMQYYNQKCTPVWSEKELLHKLEDAVKKINPAKLGCLNQTKTTQFVSTVESQKTSISAVEEWGEPEDILADSELLPVPPFDVNLLSSGFAEMVEDSSHRKQSPLEFIAVPLTVALSSIIAYRVDIRPKQCDDWTVVCNLWGVIIGSPSLMKTPCAQEALKPLKRLESLAHDKYQDELEGFKIEQKINESCSKATDSTVNAILGGKSKEDKDLTVEQRKVKAREILKRTGESENIPPIRKRYILGDSTTEKRQEIQAENEGRGLLIFRDELTGLINKLDTSGRENDRAYYTESWTGDSNYVNDTLGRGTTEVPNNTLSMIGTNQSAPWKSVLSDTINSNHKDDGFPQRFQLAVQPDTPKAWKIVDKKPNYKARQQVYDVFDYLDNLNPSTIGAKESDGKYYLNFTADAQVLFYKWWTEWENWLRNDDLPSYLISHFSKYRSLVPSLALITHLANKNIGDVDIDSTEKAIKWSEYLKAHAFRLYGSVLPIEEQTARLIAQKLLDKKLPGAFTVRELYLKHWSGITKENTLAGLEVLQEANWGRLENKTKGNKPSTCFIINPNIYLKMRKKARHNRHNRPTNDEKSPIEPIDTSALGHIHKKSFSEAATADPMDLRFLDSEVSA